EACEMLLEGVGSQNDIEQLMITGYGMRLGPFTIADVMEHDRDTRWIEKLFHKYGDTRYKTNPMIKRLLRQHNYGLSSGKGFYTYDENGEKING
ncbi:MAG: 3-hydroxyacyl-CoA dehydrogenase family protein, partial [Prolixibacteraceae bacterium]|nr:3-hydroxyacyl-CoA dehydrogenase family protein [Prolixibacteraceae bacterium]